MGDTTQIPAPITRELSGSANLTVLVKFVPDQPCYRGNENLEISIDE